MTNQDVLTEKRAEWREWAVREFGNDPRSIELGTYAILKSLIAGDSVDRAVSNARALIADAPNDTSASKSHSAESKSAVPEHLVSDAEHLRGRVSLFRARNELQGTQYGTVWNFRIDSWDHEGKSQPPVAVEMRGLQFSGSVGDGDWVEIKGPWKAEENTRVDRLRNLTMNAPVTANESASSEKTGVRWLRLLIVLIVLAILGFLILGRY